MIATRTIWRYTENSYPYQFPCNVTGCEVCGGTGKDLYGAPHILNDSELETVQPGERCDWAKGGVYEALGWAVPA